MTAQVFCIIFEPMNKLPLSTRKQIINLLVEGNSMRATSRITGCSINTVTKLLIDVGRACQLFHDEKVRSVKSQRVQMDEIWSFVYAKERNVPEDKTDDNNGDVWTWVAIDADSKLVISFLVGDRSAYAARAITQDLKMRLANRIQLTTDALGSYRDAVQDIFLGNIDFAQLVKVYGRDTDHIKNNRIASPTVIGTINHPISGSPDEKHISTSFIERQNLTMRMHMRRFTRLTNGFSKKFSNHAHAVALHFVYYNFCKIHKTLRVTPAMEAGITDDIMSIEDIVRLAD